MPSHPNATAAGYATAAASLLVIALICFTVALLLSVSVIHGGHYGAWIAWIAWIAGGLLAFAAAHLP